MFATRNFSRRLKCSGLAILVAISLLAACGKPDSNKVPAVKVQHGGNKCSDAHSYVAGKLSKNDEELFSATEAGDARRVVQAIAEGANVNATGLLKRTPLFAAAFCDRPEIARLLLDGGSQANAKDANEMSSLHAAVIIGAADTAKVLIGKGADINIRDAAGRTPLHVAAATDQASMAEILLERDANVLVRDRGGFTAAALASDNGHSALGATIRKWQEKRRTPR